MRKSCLLIVDYCKLLDISSVIQVHTVKCKIDVSFVAPLKMFTMLNLITFTITIYIEITGPALSRISSFVARASGLPGMKMCIRIFNESLHTDTVFH